MGAVALFAYFKFLFYTPKSCRAKFVESKIIIKHHFMKILSYEEYQDKMKKIKTPADALGFAQEMLAPLMLEANNAEPSAGAGRSRRKFKNPVVEVLPPVSGYRSQASDKELEEKIINLYAKGLTTRDIVNHLKETQGIEMSQSAISGITDKVFPLMKEWQAKPLSSQYPLLYLDGLWFKVRDTGKIVTKCAYIALGINQQGIKEVLGMWIAESEGAKFWLQILSELKSRGVESVLIACVDGLKGFPEAIKTVFPEAEVQVCIVHQIRHTIKFVSHKDRKDLCEDLKSVYAAPSEVVGLQALEEVKQKWPQYSFCINKWEQRWTDLAPFFGYPEQIRRIMYTTNTIENLNRQFRKVTKTTTVFPHDESLLKLLWLAQDEISRTWTAPISNWGQIITQFAILFPDKINTED